MTTEVPSSDQDANELSQSDEFSLLSMFVVVAENLKLLIGGPVLLGLLAYALTFLLKPEFTARAVILPPQQQQSTATAALQSLGALAGLAGAAAGVKNPADQYVALMQSATVSDRIITAYRLDEVYQSDVRQRTREQLAKKVNITVGKKDGLLVIEVDDESPQRAASIANKYIDELRRLTNDLAVTEAQQRRVFFDKQLLNTRDKLIAAERALQGSGINEGALRAEPRAAAEAYAEVKAQVTAAEVRLQMLRGIVTEKSSEYKQAQSSLQALRNQLNKAEASDTGAAGGDYIAKYREFRYQETLFELFAKQFELAKVDESRDGVLVQIVDAATPPERKSKPRRIMLAISTMMGSALLLFFLVFARASWRNISHDTRYSEKLSRLRAAFGR